MSFQKKKKKQPSKHHKKKKIQLFLYVGILLNFQLYFPKKK